MLFDSRFKIVAGPLETLSDQSRPRRQSCHGPSSGQRQAAPADLRRLDRRAVVESFPVSAVSGFLSQLTGHQ
jgi:hypothetical protein